VANHDSKLRPFVPSAEVNRLPPVKRRANRRTLGQLLLVQLSVLLGRAATGSARSCFDQPRYDPPLLFPANGSTNSLVDLFQFRHSSRAKETFPTFINVLIYEAK
jgi:hypothetical protein